MMSIPTRIRTLATAALLALTVVSVSAGHVHAKPRNPNDGPHCAMASHGVGWNRVGLNDSPTDPGVWFYLPGEQEDVYNFKDSKFYTLECGQNGNWRVVNVRAG